MSELRDLQQYFLGYILGKSSDIVEQIESTPALSAKGRLDIYAIAYKLRLKEALTTDYEKLHSYLGDEQFDQVMERYIEKYPSAQTNLRYYSTSMPKMLREEVPFNQMPVLFEIASIEYAFATSFDAADSNLVTMDDLAVLEPEAWANLQFNFHQSVQLLAIEYNSFAIWKALSSEKSPPELEHLSQSDKWILWRNADLVSHYRPLSPAEDAALELAMSSGSFAVICERLLDFFDEEETPMKAIMFLQSWIQEGLLSELQYDRSSG